MPERSETCADKPVFQFLGVSSASFNQFAEDGAPKTRVRSINTMLTAVRAALAEGEESFGVPHNAHIKVVSFESPTESAPPSEGDCERKESVPAVAYVAGSGGLLKRNQEVETGLAQERAKQSGNPAGAQSVNHEADRYSREVAAFQLKFDGAEEARMQAADALDESNARLADVEGKLSEYWEELLNDGADLNQIQERHREQVVL